MLPVIDPIEKTKATFQKRLIDFKTGSAEPRPEHVTWLLEVAKATNTTKEFTCHIYGFASKIGSSALNSKLSYDRANAVAAILEKANPLYSTRISHFQAKGEDGYKAPEGDNDPIWRAVEVHVFMQATPVPPKPNVDPVPPPPPKRTGMKWSVASGPSLANNPAVAWIPVQIQLALFQFRNDETFDQGIYIAPMCGAGVDALGMIIAALGQLKGLPQRLQTLVDFLGKGAQDVLEALGRGDGRGLLKVLANILLSGGSAPIQFGAFSPAKVFLPVTLHKLDGADVASASATATIKQYGALWVSGKTWYTETSGKRMFANRDFMDVPGSWSTQLQIPNFAASFVGGMLIRVK